MLLKILQKILAFMAKKIIKRHKPLVIGITGSVGKSSAKQMISLILKDQMDIRESKGNYNNEIGVPLTIIGISKSPGKNVLGWFRVFIFALIKIIFKKRFYPKILVLEMAADRPGDIEYLLKIAACNIGVITAISSAHIEFFESLENIAKEKSSLISNLPENGWAILNMDDKRVAGLRNAAKAQVLTYGFDSQADLRGLGLEIDQTLKPEGPIINGLQFKVSYRGNVIPVFLPKAISFSQAYSALAGLAVGLALGFNLIDLVQSFEKHKNLPGRMNLISGINKSLIIDDTYNSSPRAVEAALETLNKIEINSQASRWVILGDMLELGEISQKAHYQIGEKINKEKIDYLIVVGKEAGAIAQGARENGFINENVFIFENSMAVTKFLKSRIKTGDVILIKGSQKMRLERLVKEIMLQPRMAKKCLVRQSHYWLKN
ncbi:MAG: UDP-N-acetylmuramoyl-tripeptide--D-alanyl-D-alanine ligase [Patescibacteria group bacterium]|nr:UDP-N-acetylmuramoyl-tripeptide--D-alanyl-D-alanine ligase [Patescibacteria group bacterium]